MKKGAVIAGLRRLPDRFRGLLRLLRARLVKHPLCIVGLHRWELRKWGRCTRKRCDVYRSFGKAAGVEGEGR